MDTAHVIDSRILELLEFSEAELLTMFVRMDRANRDHRALMLAIHRAVNIPARECALQLLPHPPYCHPLRAMPHGANPFPRRSGAIELGSDTTGRYWIESAEAKTYKPLLFTAGDRRYLQVREWKRLDCHGDPIDVMGVEYRQRGRMTRILKAGVWELGAGIDCDCPVAGREVPCQVHSQADKLLSPRCSWALLLWLYLSEYRDPPEPGSDADPVDYLTLRRELDTVEPALKVHVMA